jgi:hypothetical protein
MVHKNDLIEVNKSLDLWSYGLLVYLAVTDTHFVQVTNKYDLANAEAYKKLFEWKDETSEQIFNSAVPLDPEGLPEAVELLMALLQRDVDKRAKPNSPTYFKNMLNTNDFFVHKFVETSSNSPTYKGKLGKTDSTLDMLDKWMEQKNDEEPDQGIYKYFKPKAKESKEEIKARNEAAMKVLTIPDVVEEDHSTKSKKKLEGLEKDLHGLTKADVIESLTKKSRFPIHDALLGKMDKEVILLLIKLVGDKKNVPREGIDFETDPLHLALDLHADTDVVLALINKTSASGKYDKVTDDDDEEFYESSMYALSLACKRMADPRVIKELANLHPDALINKECYEGNESNMSPLHIIASRNYDNADAAAKGCEIAQTLLDVEKEIIERRNGEAVKHCKKKIEKKQKQLEILEQGTVHHNVEEEEKNKIRMSVESDMKTLGDLQAKDESNVYEVDLITKKKEKHSAAEKKKINDMKGYTWLIRKEMANGNTPFMLCAKTLNNPDLMKILVKRDADRDVSPSASMRQLKTKDKFGILPVNHASIELKKREKRGMKNSKDHDLSQAQLKTMNDVTLALYRDYPVSDVLNKYMARTLLKEIFGEIDTSRRRGSVLDTKSAKNKELPLKEALIWNSIIQVRIF